jgi:hypothetical protein
LTDFVCHALFEELERTTGFSEALLKEKSNQIALGATPTFVHSVKFGLGALVGVHFIASVIF